MKQIVLYVCTTICLSLACPSTKAQEFSSPEVEQIFEQGMAALSRGNASEAVAIFQKIVPSEPRNPRVKKALAQALQFSGNNADALVVLNKMFTEGGADAEAYKIASEAYLGQKEDKKAAKVLQDGLLKFPRSGMLYYQQGMLFKQDRNFEEALKSWLDGIAAEPEFRLNYYEAAVAYVQTDEPVWAIIYGEIFVNKEPATQRGNETRVLLLDAYQKFFFTPAKSVADDLRTPRNPVNFEDAVKRTLTSLFFVVADGINTENLTMLRSRFAVSWSDNFAQKYPFALFNYHEMLMREGYFDTYNQWLFGKAENPTAFATWNTSFGAEMKEWDMFKPLHPLVLTTKDNYNRNRDFKNKFPKAKAKGR